MKFNDFYQASVVLYTYIYSVTQIFKINQYIFIFESTCSPTVTFFKKFTNDSNKESDSLFEIFFFFQKEAFFFLILKMSLKKRIMS